MSDNTNVDAVQQGLEKALERAAQSDDRELSGRVREEGKRFIFLFNGLVRMSRLHDVENNAFEKPANDCSELLAGLTDLLGAVHIICVEDQVYVNDIRLRIRNPEQQSVELLIADLARHDIGGLSVHRPLSPALIKALAIGIAGEEAPSAPRASLLAKVGEVDALELSGQYRFRVGGEPTPVQKDYSAALARSTSVVHDAVLNLAADRMPNPLPVRRVVIDLVEGLRAEPERMASASQLLRKGPIGERHLLAVCNLAIMLGERIGLSEGALSDLGVAAMLHDVGYTHRPDKAGHSAAGARVLMRQRGFHEAKVRRLLSILDHHRAYAGEGERPALFARILKIVDDFDVLTAHRRGRPQPMSPATALARMAARSGQDYDPHLFALFVQILGRYPPGTLLELSDGRWGVTTSGGRDNQRFSYPKVRIVREADGTERHGEEEIDLYEERHHLAPGWVLDPSEDGVDPDAALDDVFGTPAPAPAADAPA